MGERGRGHNGERGRGGGKGRVREGAGWGEVAERRRWRRETWAWRGRLPPPFLHPSNHHNEKSECLKAMNKSMLGVRGGEGAGVEQLVSLLTGLQSFFFFKLYLLKHFKSAQSSSQWVTWLCVLGNSETSRELQLQCSYNGSTILASFSFCFCFLGFLTSWLTLINIQTLRSSHQNVNKCPDVRFCVAQTYTEASPPWFPELSVHTSSCTANLAYYKTTTTVTWVWIWHCCTFESC